MSPKPVLARVWTEDFPRVSGDEPYQTVTLARRTGFSPRERG